MARLKDALTLSFPRAEPGRVALIDELRGIAILLVLTYHVGGVTGFPNIAHGDLGVDLFIFLSGAALAMSNRPGEGTGSFLYRRLVRLLPAYWIALTAFWIGNQRILGLAPANATNVIAHYLCIHEFWGDRYFLFFNDSFWFLSLAVLLYVVFAVLRRCMDRLDIVLGVGLTLSFVSAFVTYEANQPALFIHLGLRPSLFFLGIPFGVLLRNGTARIPMTAWFAVGAILAVYGLFVTGLLVGYSVSGFSLFLGYFAARTGAPAAGSRALCRLMAWFGTYSYEIYLLHQPLIRNYNDFAWRWLHNGSAPNEVQTAVGVAVALLITVELSILLAKFTGWLSRKALSHSGPRPEAGAAA